VNDDEGNGRIVCHRPLYRNHYTATKYKIVDISLSGLNYLEDHQAQNTYDRSGFRTFSGEPVEERRARFKGPNGGLAKVDSGFDPVVNFYSFACGAWTSVGAFRRRFCATGTRFIFNDGSPECVVTMAMP